MALRTRKARPPAVRKRTGSAILASAAPIVLDDEKTRAAWQKRVQSWQTEAWGYYDDIGEIKFAMVIVTGWGQKIRLFPAVQPDPDQPPIPVDAPDSGVSTEVASAAIDELDRLLGPEGTHGAIMGSLLVNFAIPGECILLGQDPTDEQPETWKIYSIDELAPDPADSKKWVIRSGPDDKGGTPVDPTTSTAVRLWRKHPRFSQLADSNMRGVLDRCDELLILGKRVRAGGRSRLNNGVWLVPEEVDLGAIDPTQDNDEGDGIDAFIRDLTNALSEPIHQEGSAAAIVPIIVQVPSTFIEIMAKGHLTFDRPQDAEQSKQRQEAIERIAAGLDLPAEVLLGLGTGHVNHWTADVIDEQTFKAHMQPQVELACGALTEGFLTPELKKIDGGERVFVWYDASKLIGHPEPEKMAMELYDRFVISDETLRQRTGYADDDAPSPDEIAARVMRKATVRLTDPGHNPSTIVDPAVVEGDGTTAAGAPRAITAGASPIQALGGRLAAIDRELTVRLRDAASFTLDRALETAGARLKSRAQGHPTLAAQIRDTDRTRVGMVIGPAAFQTLGTTPDEILNGTIAPLEAKYLALTRRAQERARQLLAQIDDGADQEAFAQEQDDHRMAGWLPLSTGLLALTQARIFDPHPEAPPLGEHDSSMNLPTGLIREALARAGGATGMRVGGGAIREADGSIAGGVATGSDVLELLAKMSIFVSAYTWTVGSPERPFEPHQALDGLTFVDWDDDRLANSESFPDTEFFYPQDHDGCDCDTIFDLTQTGGGEL